MAGDESSKLRITIVGSGGRGVIRVEGNHRRIWKTRVVKCGEAQLQPGKVHVLVQSHLQSGRAGVIRVELATITGSGRHALVQGLLNAGKLDCSQAKSTCSSKAACRAGGHESPGSRATTIAGREDMRHQGLGQQQLQDLEDMNVISLALAGTDVIHPSFWRTWVKRGEEAQLQPSRVHMLIQSRLQGGRALGTIAQRKVGVAVLWQPLPHRSLHIRVYRLRV